MYTSYFSLMSSPKYFRINAETFFTASFAISPSFPVATNSVFFPPGVTSDSIGNTIPEYAESEPMTAKPLTRPTRVPVVLQYVLVPQILHYLLLQYLQLHEPILQALVILLLIFLMLKPSDELHQS